MDYIFHSGFVFPKRLITYIKGFGYEGVDIFLFASGIGNYYSYTRDEQVLAFIKRRIYRLAPIYIPFIIVWSVINMIRGNLKPIFFVGNLAGIQGFSNSGISFNWYITAIIICYVVTPYFASFIKQSNIRKCAMFIVVLLLILTAFWEDGHFVISATRLPIYAIGMICAKYDSTEIEKRHVCGNGMILVCRIITK